MCQSFNNDHSENPNEKYQIGDELDVQVVEISETGFYLNTPV
jgi:ribosomal protein S1